MNSNYYFMFLHAECTYIRSFNINVFKLILKIYILCILYGGGKMSYAKKNK